MALLKLSQFTPSVKFSISTNSHNNFNRDRLRKQVLVAASNYAFNQIENKTSKKYLLTFEKHKILQRYHKYHKTLQALNFHGTIKTVNQIGYCFHGSRSRFILILWRQIDMARTIKRQTIKKTIHCRHNRVLINLLAPNDEITDGLI